MKQQVLFVLVSLLAVQVISAQVSRAIRVKAGDDVAQAYSPHGFYRFPQFVRATLYFNGYPKRSDILFNYNMLSATVQFISLKGDTLDLVTTPGFDSILFEKDVFIYNNGFLEVIAQSDSLRLLKKLVLKTEAENIGAYGQPNATGAITNIKNITSGAAVYNLIVNQDIVLTEDVSLFFVRGKMGALKANKSNLLKLLSPEKQAKAESYLKRNKTSFDKEADLKSLLEAMRI